MAELQKEIDRYQKENAALSSGRRKLQHDRKQLAKDVQEFEMQKELEKKKMDEEKKRIRKDKIMLEKSSRDRKSNFDQKAHEEIEELQAKVSFFEISHFTVVERVYITQFFFAKFFGPSMFVRS